MPADLLDIPGVYGDLAHYLKDYDKYGDPIKALVVATAIMLSVTSAYRVHVLNNWTNTDLMLQPRALRIRQDALDTLCCRRFA